LTLAKLAAKRTLFSVQKWNVIEPNAKWRQFLPEEDWGRYYGEITGFVIRRFEFDADALPDTVWFVFDMSNRVGHSFIEAFATEQEAQAHLDTMPKSKSIWHDWEVWGMDVHKQLEAPVQP
jgi:hypothetical protein